MSVKRTKKGKIAIVLASHVDVETYLKYIDVLLELVKTQKEELTDSEETFLAIDFIQQLQPKPENIKQLFGC